MCFAAGAKESGRSHRSFDQVHADEATVQVIDPEDMGATVLKSLSEIHFAAKSLCTDFCNPACFCKSYQDCISYRYTCSDCSMCRGPPPLPPVPTPMPRTSGFHDPSADPDHDSTATSADASADPDAADPPGAWELALVYLICCLVFLLCCYLNRQGPDVPPAVQQQTARAVPLVHAEQRLQPESSPQVDPRQAFHSQVQVSPLAPSAPHAPVAMVEDHHEAAISKPCCVICMVALAEFVCVPCGHMCGCQLCLSKVRQCPICRQDVKQTVKVFASIV